LVAVPVIDAILFEFDIFLYIGEILPFRSGFLSL
jgi:hypothetical protein